MHRTGFLTFIPTNNQWKVIQGLQQATHLGKKALEQMVKNTCDGISLTTTIKQVCNHVLSVHKQIQRVRLAQALF